MMSPIMIDVDVGTKVGGPVDTAAAIAASEDDAVISEEVAAACIELGVLPGPPPPPTFALGSSCLSTISERVFWWARLT